MKKTHADARSLRHRFVDDETGISLILVIGMAVVLTLTSVVGLQITNSALDRSVGHVTFESTAHLAEQGVDLALARLQKDRSWSQVPDATTPFPAAVADQEAWAVAQLALAPTISTDDGEFAVVKPANQVGQVHQVIFAAGWMPSRAAAERPRVMKAEYLFSSYPPPGAVLTGGDLRIGGDASVLGSLGDVHANGDIGVVGGSLTVSGTVTASGTLSGGEPTWSGGQPEKTVPPISPRDIYDSLALDNPTAWYDLCPNGSVRAPGAAGPCTGAELSPSGEFRGWDFTDNGGNKTWRSSSTTAYDGVYYAYQSSISVAARTATPWRTTLLAEGDPTGGCMQDEGDIDISGRPEMVSYLTGLALVAARDLVVTGTPAGGESFQGLFAAGEQVKVTGTPDLFGAILAGDQCETPGSPIDDPNGENYISGNMSITYDGGLDTALISLIRTTLWLEL